VAQVREVQVTFDCASPRRVAAFWCAVLGYEQPAPPAGFADWADVDATQPAEARDAWAAASDPTGAGPRLYFQRVPEGKVVKNRVHLDVRVATGLTGDARVAALETECARLVALGGSRVRLLEADDENEACLVMQDVEGNEFCLD
jgi:hypothetical protein